VALTGQDSVGAQWSSYRSPKASELCPDSCPLKLNPMAKKEFTDVDYEMFVMPFGEHAGKTFEEIPAEYLLWIADQDFCPDIISAYVDLNEEDLRAKVEDSKDEVAVTKFDFY